MRTSSCRRWLFLIVVGRAKPAEAPKPAAEAPKPAAAAATKPAGAAPAVAQPAAGAAKITIEFLHPWTPDQGGGGRAMVALAKRYAEIKPNVTINESIVPGAEYDRKQLAAFASGVVPDMTLTTAESVPVYGDRGALLPLDDYMKRDKLNPKDWFDFTIAQCSWQGKVFAMTHHPDVRMIVYRNVPLMTEAGIDGSKDPTSWDDLKDWGMKLNKKDGARVTQYGRARCQ